MAIDAIVIRFATAGIPEVSAAFALVETQAKKFEDSMTGASEKGGRSRVTAADREAREKIKAYQKVDKEVEKAQRTATRELERDAKRRADIVRLSSEMAGRDAVKAAREEAREIERLEEQKLRAKVQAAKQAAQAAAREAAEEMKAREKVALAGSRYAKTWGNRIGGVASMVGMTAGIGGAFAIADAGRKEFADERNAAQLVNLVTIGGKVPEGANVKNILAQAGAVSKETGVGRDEIVEASEVYAKNAQNGDFKGVMGNMGIFAKLAKVTGADMSTIAEAAGTLQSQNPELDPAAMKQLLLDANEMSKQGKMSFSESLAQMGKVGSTRSSYAGNVADNQRTLIGYAQLAKSGGTAEEVGTFTSALAMESTEANKKFKKAHHGHALFKTDQFGRIASPDTLVEDVLRNTHGNIQEINSLMGRRGGALFREVEQSYIQGAGKGNDVEAGIRNVKSYMGEVTGTRGTEAGLDAQLAQTLSTPGEKFSTAMNKIQVELEERLAPALEKFADKLSDPAVEKDIDGLISAFGSLASFLVDLGPFKGIGAILAARVALDVTNAGIGAGLKAVIARSMQASLSDKMLTGLNIATATLVVASLFNAVGSKDTGAVVSEAGRTADQIASGTAAPGSASASRVALLKRQAELKDLVEHPRTADGGKPLLGDTVAKLAAKPFTMLGLDTFENQLNTVTKALQNLDSAAKKATGGVQGIPPVSAGAPAAPIGHDSRAKS